MNISEEGIIDDGNITRISILSRNESPSYAIQNGLIPNTWINIRFDDGDVPFILIGEITNLEEDMIEITTIDKDVIINTNVALTTVVRSVSITADANINAATNLLNAYVGNAHIFAWAVIDINTTNSWNAVGTNTTNTWHVVDIAA